MSRKGHRRALYIAWLFPLFVLILVQTIYFTGGSAITEEWIKRQLIEAYGVAETQLERISLRLPGGWKPTSLASLDSPSHDHPTPASFSVIDSGVDLVLAHFGDGAIDGTDLFLQTTIELLEDTFFERPEPVRGRIEFYDDGGNPQDIRLNGITASVFPFELSNGQLQRFISSGTGVVKSGWAHIHADQPIHATSSFGLRNSAGDVLTDVGVAVAKLGQEFTVFADSIGSSRTAVAVANPHDGESLSLDFELHSAEGRLLAVEPRQLGPRGHFASFLSEIFVGFAGIEEFEGSVVIRSVAGSQLAATEATVGPPRANDSTDPHRAGDPVTTGTAGQGLPPPQNLSIQREGQDRLVLNWELPEPPDVGGGSEEFVDETEPNDDFDNPDALEIGQTARGAINPDLDVDVWRFEGTAGQDIVIDVEAESKGSFLDSVLVLSVDRDLDEDGFPDEIGFNDDFGDSFDSRLEVSLPETGGYLIEIFDAFEEGDPDFFYEMGISLASNGASLSNLGPTTAGATLQGFNIYRSVTPASPRVDPADRIANLGAEVTMFTDGGVQPSTTYRYVVTATYDQGESPPSNQVEITTLGPTQAGPSFSALTLRSTGDKLTSLPAVLPPPPDSPVTKMIFPQVGDGVFGGLEIRTTFILINNTASAASGTIDLFNSDSTPMTVTMGNQTASSFAFQVASRGVVRMVTSGTGQGVGWAGVTMDQHLSGSAIFQRFTVGGQAATFSSVRTTTNVDDPQTEVGVGSPRLRQRLTVFVNTQDPFNTGMAIALPKVEESGERGEMKNVNASLWRDDGKFIASKQVQIPLGGHTALFVPELFPDLPAMLGEDPLDINDFSGSLSISSGEFMAGLALRSAGARLTSIPTLPGRLNPFAPISTVTLAQNLAGTSPAVRWTLHQNGSDFALEKVKISAPDMGLNTEAVGVGEGLAFGYFALGSNSRVMELIAKAKGSLEFDAVIVRSDGVHVQGSGRIDGTPSGGLTLDLTLAGKEPFSEVRDDADQHFFGSSGKWGGGDVVGTFRIPNLLPVRLSI